MNSRWSADLGARYENVRAISTGDIVGVSSNRVVPRLAVGYDVQGNGRHVVHLTYGQYAGRYNEAQIGANSPVGHPADFTPTYRGPAGQGYNFAPGFDLQNYPITSANASAVVPLANVFMDPSLKSPLTHETSVSYGDHVRREPQGVRSGERMSPGRRTISSSRFRPSRTVRRMSSSNTESGFQGDRLFPECRISRTGLYEIAQHCDYQGIGVSRPGCKISTSRWNVNGHYTLQINNTGNYEGEATGMPGVPSVIGDYPEAFNAARNYPDGRLQDFQRHRLRLWSIYDVDMQGARGDCGGVGPGGDWIPGRVYSLAARNQGLTGTQRAILTAAGYPGCLEPGLARPALCQRSVLQRRSRSPEEFAGYGVLDMDRSTTTSRSSATLRPWVKFDVFNLFNNQKLIAWNTTISQDPASPKDGLWLCDGAHQGRHRSSGTATGNTVTNLFTCPRSTRIQSRSAARRLVARTLQAAIGFRFSHEISKL